MLVALVLLWPSSTAGPESDSRPPWAAAQWELETHLRDVSESSRQLMAELEAQPRPGKAPAREPPTQKQPASALVEEDDPRCKPIPVKHLGGNDLHNKCADSIPNNSFPGWDVLINGKNFDALQLATRTLWEVKTTAIETYNPFVQQIEIDKQVVEGLRERELAAACGYDFAIGVRTEAHKKMLKDAAPALAVIVMTWCK